MKGLIFRSFLDFAEQQLGMAFVEEMLENTQTDSAGVYTNIGTYDHQELLSYVAYIQQKTNAELPVLVENFGIFLFNSLANTYPVLIQQYTSSMECIYHIDQTIHKNVTKIYPNAELPDMDATFSEDNKQLTLSYQSTRPFMHLALGLIKGCAEHYQDRIDVKIIDLSNGQLNQAQFILKCQN